MPVATTNGTAQPPSAQMELAIMALLKSRAVAGRYPRVRHDMLPEKTRYRDDGCEIHPECLTCPLPRCRYDEPGGLKGVLMALRDREILRLRERGADIAEIAFRFGVSKRTIHRVLTAKYREARCA